MPTIKTLSPLEAVNEIRNNNNGQVVLVLQGGGALGAYQGGVYQALHEKGVEPDWIIGTSIGAINAALISGNAPEDRLPKLREWGGRREEREARGCGPAARQAPPCSPQCCRSPVGEGRGRRGGRRSGRRRRGGRRRRFDGGLRAPALPRARRVRRLRRRPPPLPPRLRRPPPRLRRRPSRRCSVAGLCGRRAGLRAVA